MPLIVWCKKLFGCLMPHFLPLLWPPRWAVGLLGIAQSQQSASCTSGSWSPAHRAQGSDELSAPGCRSPAATVLPSCLTSAAGRCPTSCPWGQGEAELLRPCSSLFHICQNCKWNHAFPLASSMTSAGISREGTVINREEVATLHTTTVFTLWMWAEACRGGHQQLTRSGTFQLVLSIWGFWFRRIYPGWHAGFLVSTHPPPPPKTNKLQISIQWDFPALLSARNLSSHAALWFFCFCSWPEHLKCRGQNEINKKKKNNQKTGGQTFHHFQEFSFTVEWSNFSFPLKFVPPALKLTK